MAFQRPKVDYNALFLMIISYMPATAPDGR